jgi:hypothetical protein
MGPGRLIKSTRITDRIALSASLELYGAYHYVHTAQLHGEKRPERGWGSSYNE